MSVWSIVTLTFNISKYVDYHLQPIVKEIWPYVKDTKDFIENLKQIEEVPKDSLLVTFDVKSLNINKGIKAVKEADDRHLNKIISTKVILPFLSFILTLNYFIFNSVNYTQKMGCAIGTVCASFYANMFMA